MRIGLLLCLFLPMFLPTARATDSVPSDLRAVIAERQKASLEGDSSKASSLELTTTVSVFTAPVVSALPTFDNNRNAAR